MSIEEIPFVCYASGFSESSLLCSEFLFRCTGDKKYLFLIMECLFDLKHYERILKLVEEYGTLTDVRELKVIYYKSCLYLGKKVEVKGSSAILERRAEYLAEESVDLLFKGLGLKSERRRECLLAAMKADERNFESFINIWRDSLGRSRRITPVMSGVNKEICDFYFSMVNTFEINSPVFSHFNLSSSSDVFSPIYAEILAKSLFKRKLGMQLFSLATSMLDLYPGNEVSAYALGLFYLHSKNYKESRNAFYKSVEENERYVSAWIALGISYLRLQENESSIACFKKARDLTSDMFVPYLYLACVYTKIACFEKAKENFLLAQELDYGDPILVFRYSYFLLYSEQYEEFFSYNEKISNTELFFSNDQEKAIFSYTQSIILALANIFSHKTEETINIIKEMEIDWKTTALLSFILMMKKDYAGAIYHLTNVLIEKPSKIFKEMINTAVELEKNKIEFDCLEYTEEFIVALELEEMLPLPI